FVCDGCNKKHYIFKSGGGKTLAEKFGIPFLGEIPMVSQVVEGGDTGVPILMGDPESPASEAYRELAGQMAAQLSIIQSTEDRVDASFELAWKS
ncbi:MAG: P-loop NTPase, partial [Nitrospinaceae bacterium]|nr:Mrp/NBP35 family ATP-binding protein [Nitrospinaceae bacterium]NIR55428.1 Mrp/NBP35 family ATP-binding protein [Nitrospinaceae bacterium]NIS85868.1 Mrp/NBP35 family ATP-binding protein [Nitrospinaceae bacterium]NIT82712.1 Mrp/NBP35 family ATP-binding protein [Nitrospinaceae bacterium]NIU44921.1 Mrp/NBP35 family ATP-binding protein [Nitrospinaceae bacterium]